MSNRGPWTHSLCLRCWMGRNTFHLPYVKDTFPADTCCACAATHTSGIYCRESPDAMLCKGEHPMPAA